MPEQSNNPLNFWQELKRRKVIRVIIGYAATAFIIMEAGDIMLPRLGLPDWTVTFIIILLIVGFPIAIIFSWIFDITPEGVKKTESGKAVKEKEVDSKPTKRKLKVSNGIIAVLVVVVCILLYPKIFKRDRLEYLQSKGEISLAVMPFQNISNDESKDFWQEMIQDNLITYLSNAGELKVRQSESIKTILQYNDPTNYASITPSVAREVSQKLEASVFVNGSISQMGEIIRINAKLVDSDTEKILQSFQIDGPIENIIYIADSLSLMIKDYLIISLLKKDTTPEWQTYLGTTKSPQALGYFLDGKNLFLKREYAEAREMFHNAIKIDSNFTTAAVMLAFAYGNAGLYKDAKKWSLKAYENRDNILRTDRILAEYTRAWFINFNPLETIKYLKQILEIDDKNPINYWNLGQVYNSINQYEMAIPEFEMALKLYDDWGIKPMWIYNYISLGWAYHKTDMYKKEKRLYRKAEKDFPDDPTIIEYQAGLALSKRKINAANEYLDKYISALEKNSYTEAAIASTLGSIYEYAQLLDKAEEYFLQAVSLEPDRPSTLGNLASFLVDNDRNVDEGMKLIEKALEIRPDHYTYLDTKGWGLYKQGKFQDALEILHKSWDLRMENAIYNHEAFLHIEAAKKAVAKQISEE